MSTFPDVTVVISTFNRCEQLRHALDSLLGQQTDGVTWEAVVVDNNSTDDTPTDRVVHRPAQYAPPLRVRTQAGALLRPNPGISHATAPLIAFTDDDVQPSPDWVRRIKRCFDAHPDAEFIGGKVLPRWSTQVPAWLTPDHWSPLALVDYGDGAFVVNAGKPYCLVGANLAFRRDAFDRAGLFAPVCSVSKTALGPPRTTTCRCACGAPVVMASTRPMLW